MIYGTSLPLVGLLIGAFGTAAAAVFGLLDRMDRKRRKD